MTDVLQVLPLKVKIKIKMKKSIVHTGLILFTVFVTAFFASCNNSGKDKKPDNQQNPSPVKEEVPIQQAVTDSGLNYSGAPSAKLPDGKYSVDLNASKLDWYCVVHKGYVLLKNGNITINNGKITGGNFEILMDSIVDIDIDYYLMKATLENTLKSDMFFDVKKYPESVFKISSVTGKGDNRYRINGDLKIKDIVKPVSFISTITIKNDTLYAKSERFSINRTAWGITIYSKNYPQTDDSFLFTDYIDFVITLVMTKEP